MVHCSYEKSWIRRFTFHFKNIFSSYKPIYKLTAITFFTGKQPSKCHSISASVQELTKQINYYHVCLLGVVNVKCKKVRLNCFFGAQDILTASTARPRHSEVIYKTNKKIQYLKTLLALQKIVVKKFSIFPDSK